MNAIPMSIGTVLLFDSAANLGVKRKSVRGKGIRANGHDRAAYFDIAIDNRVNESNYPHTTCS